MINLVIPKPGVFFFIVFNPTLTTRFIFLLSHFTDLAGNAIFRKWYIVFVLFPLPYFIYAAATIKCNFAFVSRFQWDSPFYLVKSGTAGGAATWGIN